jgi:diacylglycerol kinase family enzyme
MNAIDTTETSLAFLPFGTGNALRHAFGYHGDIPDMAIQIKKGSLHHCDLIGCEQGKKAFMISIGIETSILRQYRKQIQGHGQSGFLSYVKAVLLSILREYTPGQARIVLDGRIYQANRLLSLMIMKQPYYGYGLKVLPKAKFNDHLLHVSCSRFSWPDMILAGATVFTVGNRAGRYQPCRNTSVFLENPLYLQIDGDIAWQADHFQFRILPDILRVRC